MVGASLHTQNHSPKPIKFLCSYGGRILPRYPDAKLRYHGGETRVLSVDRSVSFAELMVKLGEMCGSPVNLRCQLPTEDLDALVSIKSDEDLNNLIEEYDRRAAPSSLKIRAFLSAPKTAKRVSPPSSSASSCSTDATSPRSPVYSSSGSGGGGGLPPRCPTPATGRCIRAPPRPPVYPVVNAKAAGKIPYKYPYQHQYHGNGGHVYLIHNGHHWH